MQQGRDVWWHEETRQVTADCPAEKMDAEEVAKVLKEIMGPGERITAYPRTNSLVIHATEETFTGWAAKISAAAKASSRPRNRDASFQTSRQLRAKINMFVT